MPYIDPPLRKSFKKALLELELALDNSSPGELNYVISRIIHSYMANKGLNYRNLNDVVGVLESAKAEFQRRVVAPYEDEKIKQNGDL